MQPNNNPFAEISALVLAVLLIVAGAVLLFFGKIGYDNAVFFFLSALGVFGINGAFKAPSPTQQAALLQLAAQALQAQAQPMPVALPQNVGPYPTNAANLTVPQNMTAAAQPAPVVQLPFPASSVAMTPAMRTTLNVPAVQSGQVQQ